MDEQEQSVILRKEPTNRREFLVAILALAAFCGGLYYLQTRLLNVRDQEISAVVLQGMSCCCLGWLLVRQILPENRDLDQKKSVATLQRQIMYFLGSIMAYALAMLLMHWTIPPTLDLKPIGQALALVFFLIALSMVLWRQNKILLNGRNRDA